MTNSRLPWVLKGGDFSHPGWHTHPTAAYQMMFEFLRLSPSYELARIARTRKLFKLERSSIPKDFDLWIILNTILHNLRSPHFISTDDHVDFRTNIG